MIDNEYDYDIPIFHTYILLSAAVSNDDDGDDDKSSQA